MMDFGIDDDITELRGVVRDFAARHIDPFAAEWVENKEFPTDVFRGLSELGLMGMLIPEQYGGAGAGFVEYVAVMEELGRADQSIASTWNAHSTIASLPLLRFGTEEQKQKWLVPLAQGEALGAFALTEPSSGSDAASIRTSATKVDGGWLLNGNKMFITNAGTPISLGVSLLAVTGDGPEGRRYGTFFVPNETPGYTKGSNLKKLGWHASDTRELIFENCFIPEENLIGEEGRGLKQFLEVLDPGRISVAALGLSLASTALELAVTHARDREQFGRPIGTFQAVAHKIADMSTEVDAARLLVYRAAWLADAGLPFSEAAAKAKLYTSELANRAASASLQIHGGYGYMAESKIARFYADAKILEIGEGTNEIQRNVIARGVLQGGDS